VGTRALEGVDDYQRDAGVCERARDLGLPYTWVLVCECAGFMESLKEALAVIRLAVEGGCA
jgi:hypothetical protein